jgi:hypothetical protein
VSDAVGLEFSALCEAARRLGLRVVLERPQDHGAPAPRLSVWDAAGWADPENHEPVVWTQLPDLSAESLDGAALAFLATVRKLGGDD